MFGFKKKVETDKLYQIRYISGGRYLENTDEIAFPYKMVNIATVSAGDKMEAISKFAKTFPLFPNMCILNVDRLSNIIV